ncbi:hypothetical protein ACLOJK_019214 [Asimina triloba]
MLETSHHSGERVGLGFSHSAICVRFELIEWACPECRWRCFREIIEEGEDLLLRAEGGWVALLQPLG